jgi:zinc protease
LEEWRLGRGAQQRMRDEYFPILFKDSRYAERLPIGTKDIIENASYERIEQFYRDWYRPDLMALIAVGDFEMDEMEAKIKRRFSKLEAVKDPREKVSNEVPDHQETLVAITKDKENTFTTIQLVYKQDKAETNDLGDFRDYYLRRIYNTMLSKRLQELTQSSDPPFIFGSSNYGGFVRGKDSYFSFAACGENDVEKALRALVVENERVKLHGFTEGEFERALTEISTQLERATKERDKTESRRYVNEYVNHYLDDEPIPGIEFEFSFFEDIKDGIELKEINQLAGEWISDENRVVLVLGIDKEGVTLPTEEDILNILDNIDQEEIEPYEDNVGEGGLVDELPPAGRVLFTKKLEEVEASELTLTNGMKVVIKPTDFKNDEILMTSYSMGGHSLYELEDYYSASNAASIVNQSGIKDFSNIDLQKMLTGKVVQVSPYISSVSEGFNGSCAPKDFETMLQLIHLYFTAPRKDSSAFQSLMTRNKMLFKNLMSDPQFYYNDQVSKIMTQDHPRGGGFPTPEDMEKVELERAFEIFKERFANADQFRFFFVGNVNIEEAKPLLEKYLGSIPKATKKEGFQDLGIFPLSYVFFLRTTARWSLSAWPEEL